MACMAAQHLPLSGGAKLFAVRRLKEGRQQTRPIGDYGSHDSKNGMEEAEA